MLELIVEHVINNYTENSAKRLYHGRGKKFPLCQEIALDYYPPFLVWEEYLPPDENVILLKTKVKEWADKMSIKGIIHKKRYQSDLLENKCHVEFLTDESDFDLSRMITRLDIYQFYVDLISHQNSGLFLDFDGGRKWLSQNAKNKKILNLFSYTCSLSVVALMNGASHVTNVDMKKNALAVGKDNHVLNQLPLNKVSFLPYDIFNSWGKITAYGPYDIIIIDPPSDQKKSFLLSRDYPKMMKRLLELTNPGSKIFAAVNSPFYSMDFLHEQFSSYLLNFKLEMSGFSSYVENDMEVFPEKGLKFVVYERSI